MSAKEGDKGAEKEEEKKDNNTSQVGAHCSMNDLTCFCVPFVGLFAVCFFFQYVRLTVEWKSTPGNDDANTCDCKDNSIFIMFPPGECYN